MMEKQTKIYFLLAMYVGGLYAANLLGGKVFSTGIGGTAISVAIFIFPFLFLITDIIGEVLGKKEAQRFVKIGLLSLIVLLVWQFISVVIPGHAPNVWYMEFFNPGYSTVFTLSITFTIASIVAFILGQYFDLKIFHKMKEKNPSRLLWLRNNVSTTIAQLVDSTVFIFIAFSTQLLNGNFTPASLFLLLVLPYWIAKIIFAFIDTPLFYYGVKWLRD